MRNVPYPEPLFFLTISPTSSTETITSMERLTLVLLLLLTAAMINDDRRWRWRRRSRRRWPIEQIPQVVLELQVGPGPARDTLDGQIRAPVASGEWRSRGRAGADGRFVLHVELAQGVHQGAVLVLPALLQQRLGRNVVQIVWPGLSGCQSLIILVFRELGKISTF